MKISRVMPSEATIQAELYGALKAVGLRPVLEQSVFLETKTRRGKPERIRIDVLLLNENDDAFAAIEVKNASCSKGRPNFSHHRQYRKYTQLGLPFRYCMNMSEVAECIQWAREQDSENVMQRCA